MASIDKRPNGKWRARYREHPGGPQRARHFDHKVYAKRFLTMVGTALASHLERYTTAGDGLIFTNESDGSIGRNRFGELWRSTVEQTGLSGLRFHDLRHFYASLLMRHGESIKVVQARLGHASASETLDTYSHLWPDNEARTRAAVDEVLGAVMPGDRRTG